MLIAVEGIWEKEGRNRVGPGLGGPSRSEACKIRPDHREIEAQQRIGDPEQGAPAVKQVLVPDEEPRGFHLPERSLKGCRLPPHTSCELVTPGHSLGNGRDDNI